MSTTDYHRGAASAIRKAREEIRWAAQSAGTKTVYLESVERYLTAVAEDHDKKAQRGHP